jgi:hypothetical protein
MSPPQPLSAAEGADACLPNIGPVGQQRRMRFGVRGLVVGALASAGLVASGVGRPWRLLVLPFFWTAATGIFQARGKT